MASIVGRERELSLAEEFLDSASERFAVLVLEGEPGIGKTTVWRATVRRAEERGSLTGTRNRTVRAPRGSKRARVAYSVTAHDDVDGAVPVTCSPRSGSWFRIGRTVVRCSVTDTSANEAMATFAVTVKRAR